MCENNAIQTQAPIILEEGIQGTQYSAEIEQTATQKNTQCDNSLCQNNLIQTQAPVILGGGP